MDMPSNAGRHRRPDGAPPYGLTLVELVACLVVLGLFSAAAYPVFSGMLARQQVMLAADRLAMSLALARASALSRRIEVTLQPLPGEATLSPGWQLVTAGAGAERPEVLSVVEPGMPCLSVTLRQAALWNECTTLQVCDSSVEKWLFSVEPAVLPSATAVTGITVSDILRETGRRRIDILKLDIEGAERELFSTSSEDWLPFVRLIVIELHDRFKVGCSEAFYKRISQKPFMQEVRGENIFVLLDTQALNAA